MRCQLLSILLLAGSATANAFTEAEKIELAKFHQGRIECARGLQWLSNALPTARALEDRETMHRILEATFQCIRISKAANERFLHEFGRQGDDRALEVSRGKDFVGNTLDAIAHAKEVSAGWMDDASVSTAMDYLDRAAAHFSSMDLSLDYFEWKPASFPRVIGPHGDYALSRGTMKHVGHYLQRSLGDVILFYEEVEIWPATAAEPFRSAIANWAQAHQKFIRAQGLDAEIVLEDDRQTIQNDTDASSGLRPFDFFRVLLEFEYVFGDKGGPRMHTNRRSRDGMRKDLQAIEVRMTQVLHATMVANTQPDQPLNDLTTPEERIDILERMAERTAKIVAHTDPGNDTFGEFRIDFPDMWQALDTLGIAWMGFFHAIPAPPPAGPCPECPTEVTCGTGTFLHMGECLPESIDCPTVGPELFLNPEGAISVRCIQ